MHVRLKRFCGVSVVCSCMSMSSGRSIVPPWWSTWVVECVVYVCTSRRSTIVRTGSAHKGVHVCVIPYVGALGSPRTCE
jgi:hypothetical protein